MTVVKRRGLSLGFLVVVLTLLSSFALILPPAAFAWGQSVTCGQTITKSVT
jgi:hypothetical protein